jgi:iron complex outermembrane receptor protein
MYRKVNELTPLHQLAYYNGGAARTYGTDFDVEARVTSGLTLNAGISALHDRFTNFPNAQYNVPNPLPAGGSTTYIGSAKGNRLPETPDWTFNFGLTYELQSSIGEWSFNTNYLHNSGWFGEVDNELRQKAYDTVDASMYLYLPGDRYNIGVWGRNLLNEKVYTSVEGNATTGLSQYAPPRTYGIKIGMTL